MSRSKKTYKVIKYFSQNTKVDCDRKCNKAWGINNRPKDQLSDNEDDYEWLSDDELPEAPEHPGTWEGRDTKPKTPDLFPNKWCVRECERSVLSDMGKFNDPVLEDFSKRVPNLHSRRESKKAGEK